MDEQHTRGLEASRRPAALGLAAEPSAARSSLLPGNATACARSDAPPLGRLGSLEVRLARSDEDIRRAQALRYRVFYDEGLATGDGGTHRLRRDADAFDAICDHVIVTDEERSSSGEPGGGAIVGTYRLLRQEVADRHGGFYTAGEFNVEPLLARKRGLRFLELGRSCVLPRYRNTRTLELMWHGIWAYVLMHRVDVMLGCASLEGTDPDRLGIPLSFLHHQARAPQEWLVSAHETLRVDMDMMPAGDIDPRAGLRSLPPLIKGYLRLGAFVGDGAVIDRAFGTTDVCIIMPVARLSPRYLDHYGRDARRFAS